MGSDSQAGHTGGMSGTDPPALARGLAIRVARAKVAISVALAIVALAPSRADSQPLPEPRRAPLVFVAGTTGTKLAQISTGKLVWGKTMNLFRPRDRGYSLALPVVTETASHPQARFRPAGPLLDLRLLLWKKQIYGPFLAHFLGKGRKLGRFEATQPGADLFFFDYDWRLGVVDTALELAAELDELGSALGGSGTAPLAVDLICQSNAAKTCRYLVKYGALPLDRAEAGHSHPPAAYRIRKLILVGASNGGALRTLELMTRGRRYVALLGRKLSQEAFFSIRPLFTDLPIQRKDLFFDPTGKTIDIDLASPTSWIEYGWSVFASKPQRRLARARRPDLFGSRADRTAYLGAQLDRAARLQRLLANDAPDFGSTRYYHLENESVPTAERALLAESRGRWKVFFFDDRRVARNPDLKALAVSAGDGHATLGSQRALSPQEQAASAGSALVRGGHFEMIIEPAGLNALSSFLADPVP